MAPHAVAGDSRRWRSVACAGDIRASCPGVGSRMIILSAYPLSTRNLDAVSPPDGTRLLTLNALRMESPARLWRALRAARSGRLQIMLQEPTERALLPLMLTLAAFVPTACIEVRDLGSGQVEAYGRLRAALGVLGIVRATLSGWTSVWRLKATCRRLSKKEALGFGPLSGVRALYVKTNLMLGAKAGGSIGHIAGVVDELHARDAKMLLLAPEFPPMVQAGVRFRPVPALQTYGMPPEVNHFRFNRPCVAAGHAALQEESFDFIYQRLTLGNLAGVLLARRHRIPLVIEYNGSEVWVARHWGYKSKFESLAAAIEDVCLRHAHRVVAVSRVLADELVARGVPADRVVWYPELHRSKAIRSRAVPRCALALAKLVGDRPGRRGMPVHRDLRRMAWRGGARAGGANLPGATPRGIALALRFRGRWSRLPAVRALLQAESESGDVVFSGLVPQDEAPQWLAMADVFCSPHVQPADGSEFFGSPTKLFEYMAMGGAIIASDVAQVGEVLSPALPERTLDSADDARGGEIAVLVPPGDPAALARAIVQLAGRAALRLRLGQAARERALQRYTWRRHVDVIVDSLR